MKEDKNTSEGMVFDELSKLSFEELKNTLNDQRVAIVGIGGSGGNALIDIYKRPELQEHKNIDYFAANTDITDLMSIREVWGPDFDHRLILLGPQTCGGEGAGGRADLGKKAIEESIKVVQEKLKGYRVVILAFGLGGGTGSAAAPAIVDMLKSMKVLTIGVANLPFEYEGAARSKRAMDALEELDKNIDTLIVVPNDRIREAYGLDETSSQGILMDDAFATANCVLASAASSILNIIKTPGKVNIDFNDLKNTLENTGRGIISSATSQGDLRTKEALDKALNNPLISTHDVKSVSGIIANIYTNHNLGMHEFDYVINALKKYMDDESKVTVGYANDPSLAAEDMRITIILTGIDAKNKQQKEIDAKNKQQKKIMDAGSESAFHLNSTTNKFKI